MTIINKQLDTQHTPASVTLLRTLGALASLQAGQILLLTSRQYDTCAGIQAMCRQTGHILMQHMVWDGEYSFLIRKPDHHTEQVQLATDCSSPAGGHDMSNSFSSQAMN
jgi:tRNA 2-thiouridine synthesizing protein A